MSWRDRLIWGIERVLNDGLSGEDFYKAELPSDHKIVVTRRGEIVCNSEYLYSLSGHWKDAIRKEVNYIMSNRIDKVLKTFHP